MAKIYYEKDADLKILENKTIGIVGFGIQGSAQAKNLRDSGLKVVISELKNTTSWEEAIKSGFEVLETKELVKQADIIQLLTQDDVQPKVYKEEIEENLKPGKALFFSSGFNIHFEQIVPLPNVDVVMVAPKGPGSLVRSMYEQKKGVPALLAIYQDYTNQAKAIGLAYAKGIGSTRIGVIETTFAEETETDLFGEQVVLCGGVSELIKAGFETLVEAGYQPEIAYFECLHELKLICDMIYNTGIYGMRVRISDTAKYGDLTRGKRIINENTRKEMKKILEEIQTGNFTKEWILENQAKRPVFKTLLKKDKKHLIEKTGEKLREMMNR